jgi:hypothetical protein
MANRGRIPNIMEALLYREPPIVTAWNRLEGRPRTANFDRALKAEVRDALWMLTRQWQFGEFRGNDAGSPIFTKVHLSATRLKKYKARNHDAEVFEEEVPLEAKVERHFIPFTMAETDFSLDLRLLMGRHWIKLVKKAVGDFSSDFIAKYPLHEPDPNRAEDALICAHPESYSAFAAVTNRSMDGARLYQYLIAAPTRHAYDGIASLEPHKAAIDNLAQRFIQWFQQLIYQPDPRGDDAWDAARLEYQFACSGHEATGEKVLVAEQYYQGHLDWHNVDVDVSRATLGSAGDSPDINLPESNTQTLLPTPMTFVGMPNTRWWAFEEGRTNFGDVKPDTTDLAKLMLVEFGLIYANDWFVIPFKLPRGCIARVSGMAVTNVFGERTWIKAAGRDWQRWGMFLPTVKGGKDGLTDTSLLLLPTAPLIHDGELMDDIFLIRDDVADMVWGVEKSVPLPTGESKPGGEAADEFLTFHEKEMARHRHSLSPQSPVIYNAGIRYQVMNTVPENWIPFIPVHVAGDNRAIQLQRAALPRILEGDRNKPKKVEPRTSLLREGLDRTAPTTYCLHEEEVPRSGVRLMRTFRRTRWSDGRVWVWLAVCKQIGRGEGASGLAFDRILNVSQS